MHQERYAVVARQAIYDTVNLLAVVTVLGNIVLELLWLVDVKEIVGVVDESLVAYHLAVVVDEDVTHYGIYPSFEIRVRGVFVHVA